MWPLRKMSWKETRHTIEIAEAKFKKFDSIKSTAHGAMGFWFGDINKIYVLRSTN